MRNKIPNKQIGWSEQSNMIYDVLREWNSFNNELYIKTCCSTTGNTTTSGPIMICLCYVITNNQKTTQSYLYKDCVLNEVVVGSVPAESQVSVCTKANYIPEPIKDNILTIEPCVNQEQCFNNTDCSICISSTTSTSTSSTPTTSTTTTTTPPCCTAGTLEVNVVSPGVSVTGINIDELDGWYDVGSIGFPVDNTVSPRTAVLYSNADGALNIIVDNDDVDNDHYLYVYFNCVQVGSCCVIPSRSTGHVCSFPGFPISSYETDCIKIEVTNVSCT